MIKLIHQYIAIYTFTVLTFIGLFNKNFNIAGLNFSLVLLYIFIYLQPFNKGI